MKAIDYLFIVLSLGLAQNTQSQGYEWAINAGGTGFDNVTAMAQDIDGNVIVAGDFTGSVDLNPGVGVAALTSEGVRDVYLAKYDSNGDYVWAVGYGGIEDDQVFGVDTDSDGNVYATGYFQGTVDFNPGPGTDELTSNGSWDIFIIKFDSNGVYEWAHSIGSTDMDAGYELAADAAGNAFITGYFTNTVDFDPGIDTEELTSQGGNEIFIAKFNTDGELDWAKSMESTSSNFANSLKIADNGHIALGGFYYGSVDFDTGAGTEMLTTSNASADMFLAQYDNNGNYIWAKSIGGPSFDRITNLAFDNNLNIYCTGSFSETVDFDPGSGTANLIATELSNAFFAKYDMNGNYVWAKVIESDTGDLGIDLAVDAVGNCYLSGYFTGTSDFDPGVDIENLTATGQTDIFMAKYNEMGNYIWAHKIGSSSDNNPAGIAFNNSGAIYLAGYFSGTTDFDITSSVDNLTSIGSVDLFVAKYNDPTVAIQEKNKFELSVYPNPAKDFVVVEISDFQSTQPARITDVSGKNITITSVRNNRTIIDTSDLKSGLYFVHVRNEVVKLFVE